MDFSSRSNNATSVLAQPWSSGMSTKSDLTFWHLLLIVWVIALPLASPAKDKLSYGEGLIVNVPMPETEVAPVVEDIAQNGVIRGTKEYNKDEFVAGAKAASSSRLFPAWNEG